MNTKTARPSEKEEYCGIDYSMGQSNVNKETGIHYGVISQNSLNPDALNDDIEPYYGKPHCPRCRAEAKAITNNDRTEEFDDYKFAEHECSDFSCDNCKYVFSSESAFPDEPIGLSYENNNYVITDCLDTDLFIIKSPFYTFAQFCSPCVPGAGNLNSPCPTGPKTYCLGHEWFDGEKAPYTVYSVETGETVENSKLE